MFGFGGGGLSVGCPGGWGFDTEASGCVPEQERDLFRGQAPAPYPMPTNDHLDKLLFYSDDEEMQEEIRKYKRWQHKKKLRRMRYSAPLQKRRSRNRTKRRAKNQTKKLRMQECARAVMQI